MLLARAQPNNYFFEYECIEIPWQSDMKFTNIQDSRLSLDSLFYRENYIKTVGIEQARTIFPWKKMKIVLDLDWTLLQAIVTFNPESEGYNNEKMQQIKEDV